jgi:hypothetical protein
MYGSSRRQQTRLRRPRVLPKDLLPPSTSLTIKQAEVFAEQKRCGREPAESVEPQDKPRTEAAAIHLTLGKLNAVRAAFKVGVKPSQIARQFGLSQSDVRQALASDASARVAIADRAEGTCELVEVCRDVLPAAPLRIDQGSHGHYEVGRLDRPLVAVRVPGLEQLHDLAMGRIVGLDAFDALDRIAAAQRDERGTAPSTLVLEAAKRATAFNLWPVRRPRVERFATTAEIYCGSARPLPPPNVANHLI